MQLDPTGTLPPIPTFPDLYNDPVLNPVSALTLLIQNGLSSGFGANAAEVGWTGIYQNMLPSINDISTQFTGISTQLENLLTGGSFSTSAINTDFTNIGTDFTTIEKFLSLAPTTLLNDYLNGYPGAVGSPGPACRRHSVDRRCVHPERALQLRRQRLDHPGIRSAH